MQLDLAGTHHAFENFWWSFLVPCLSASLCSSRRGHQYGYQSDPAAAPISSTCNAESSGRAVTLPRAIVEVAAWAGIHGGCQHETSGKCERHGGASDANRAILQRLAHDFQNVAGELGQFVEKEHAIVRQ